MSPPGCRTHSPVFFIFISFLIPFFSCLVVSLDVKVGEVNGDPPLGRRNDLPDAVLVAEIKKDDYDDDDGDNDDDAADDDGKPPKCRRTPQSAQENSSKLPKGSLGVWG